MPLLAVILGGTTARWSQGIVLCLLGVILVVAPPRLSLGWKLNLVLAGLVALALTGFLPAAWFGQPTWRAAMVDDLGFVLPTTLSPQPWLTAESSLLFLAGLCWFYLMATVNWSPEERTRAGRLMGAGVVASAAVFLLLFERGVVVPIWLTERNFGPFPNRNQTANFLAVGALPVLACAQLAWRAERRVAAVGWLAGWLIIAVATFTSFSRAGVVLLFVGTAIYVLVQALRARSREVAAADSVRGWLDRWRGLALAVSLVAVLLSAFLLFGGETLKRLTPTSTTSTVHQITAEFRLRIQGDALHMIAASPWCGVGLGNFAAIFPIFRVSSALPARAIHPESDWLWMVAELGWGALALLLAGLVLLQRGIWPWRRMPDRPMRTAAAIALVAFAVHSFVDVSAHRLGTCLCAMFVLSLALRGEAPGMPPFRLPARWPVPVFRLLGLVLLLAGGNWIAGARGMIAPRGAEGVALLEAGSAYAAERRDYAAVEQAMDQALVWAPLDWTLYFTRAGARADLGRDPDEAAADFQRARYLEPFIGAVPRDEARIWLSTGHAALAVNALVEACRREPAHAEEYVGSVFNVSPDDEAFQKQMGRIARGDPQFFQPFFNQLRPPQNGEFIASYLRSDPELRKLSSEQRLRFFADWARAGNAAELCAKMAQRPDWQQQGWRWWAEGCARTGAYEQACGIAVRFAPPPVVPHLADVELIPTAELEQEAAAAPGDAALALRLYTAERKAGMLPAELAALRRIAKVPGAPAYFRYLEALSAAEGGDWAASWEAWGEFLEATSK